MKAAKAISKGYVNTPEGQIHYLSAGEGEPLVLIHCTSDSSAMWEPVLPIFGEMGYRTIALDIPGHGNSDPPPHKPTGPEYASRINEACQLLGLKQYSILGHHFGATVTAWVAANYPANVKKCIFFGLTLIDPEWQGYMKEVKPRIFDKNGDEIVRFLKVRVGLSEGGQFRDRVLPPTEKSIFDSYMVRRVITAYLQADSDWYFAYHTIGATDHFELGKRIQVPVLYICADRDPVPVPRWQDKDTVLVIVKK